MFRCQITNKTSSDGEKLNRIVVKTNPRVYTQRFYDEIEGEVVELEVGNGYEIVKEINASNEGLRIWKDWSSEEKERFLSLNLKLKPPFNV